jgi:hypothetical protein
MGAFGFYKYINALLSNNTTVIVSKRFPMRVHIARVGIIKKHEIVVIDMKGRVSWMA